MQLASAEQSRDTPAAASAPWLKTPLPPSLFRRTFLLRSANPPARIPSSSLDSARGDVSESNLGVFQALHHINNNSVNCATWASQTLTDHTLVLWTFHLVPPHTSLRIQICTNSPALDARERKSCSRADHAVACPFPYPSSGSVLINQTQGCAGLAPGAPLWSLLSKSSLLRYLLPLLQPRRRLRQLRGPPQSNPLAPTAPRSYGL